MPGVLNMKSKETIFLDNDNEWLKALNDPEYMKKWPLAIDLRPKPNKLVVSEKQRRGLKNNG